MNKTFIFLLLLLTQCQTPVAAPEIVAKVAETPKISIAEPDPEMVALKPIEAIKKLDGTIEGYHLGQNLTPEQEAQNLALKSRIVRGTFDISELCRLSLGKHWDAIVENKRQQFVEMMTQLLEKRAIFSREQLKGQNKLYKIDYLSEVYEPSKERATVSTRMLVPKESLTIQIQYKLIKTNFGWKIFDVIVDEASLLSNYKSRFHQIITENGFDELLNRVQKKLSDT